MVINNSRGPDCFNGNPKHNCESAATKTSFVAVVVVVVSSICFSTVHPLDGSILLSQVFVSKACIEFEGKRMKRGKDEEKIMGPMFPRLHVNDTEKGGPRAPPRNKMALYEQLCIPSQRLNPGVFPNPNNNSNLVAPASSSQGSGLERNLRFPLHLTPSPPAYQAERFDASLSDGATRNASLAQLEQRRRVREEDDFMVPVFVQSSVDQNIGELQNGIDRENFTPRSSTPSEHPMKTRNTCEDDPKLINSMTLNSRREVSSESEENPIAGAQGRDFSGKSSMNQSIREKSNVLVKEAKASPNQESRDHHGHNFSRFHDNEAYLQHESRAESQLDSFDLGNGLVEFTRDKEKGTSCQGISNSPSEEDHNSPSVPDNDSECNGNRTCISLQIENVDKSDDVSETSMVDSMEGLDISPDDVVGIIGQKHFWKARRAISNQQRVFAVQVFELHRLIKVQRHFAGSPHLLLEDGTFLGKSSLMGSSAKKIPPEYVVKPLPQIGNRKDDSEKQSRKMECYAENAVVKTSLSSVNNGSQPSHYGGYFGNPLPAPVTGDNKMGPWCFNQSPGHQWLVPVMSPSEGLVYKPYPGPGFMGTVCGGPPGGHAYFPPYGAPVTDPTMSTSAVEQTNCNPGPGLQNQNGQLSGVGANFNVQQQTSCNVPTQKNVSQGMRSKASKGSELQGSTASSPGERVQGVRKRRDAGGRDALEHFPSAPVVPEEASQPPGTDQPSREQDSLGNLSPRTKIAISNLKQKVGDEFKLDNESWWEILKNEEAIKFAVLQCTCSGIRGSFRCGSAVYGNEKQTSKAGPG
ncbi:hypothetical protein FNV43_RR12683 [Rhamnella rubrinervis]|uniref:Uncharacterized protein n=1 Tax=Rhamnella rubrinervis TaxID=2594499 RepID=A0A8K0H7S7_9ROSA|nr:hypothetical protein FNV43_RR12683 [Rhamnella rubrinervis]